LKISPLLTLYVTIFQPFLLVNPQRIIIFAIANQQTGKDMERQIRKKSGTGIYLDMLGQKSKMSL
jgi:hypothetical protein